MWDQNLQFSCLDLFSEITWVIKQQSGIAHLKMVRE